MLSQQLWKHQPDYFRSIRSTENMGEIRFTGISTGLRRGVEHCFWRVASRVLPEKACYVQGSGVHASIPRNKLNHVTGSRNRSLKRNMEERRRRRRRPLRFSFRAIMITLGRIEIPVLTSGKASLDFDGSIFWNVVLADWYRDRSLRADTYGCNSLFTDSWLYTLSAILPRTTLFRVAISVSQRWIISRKLQLELNSSQIEAQSETQIVLNIFIWR